MNNGKMVPGQGQGHNLDLNKQELQILRGLSGRRQEDYVQMHTLREQDLLIDSNNKYLMESFYKDQNPNPLYEDDGEHDPPKSCQINKKVYLDNYAVRFSIPTSYVLNARIFGGNNDYLYQVVKFVIPSEEANEPDLLMSKIEPSQAPFFNKLGTNSMMLRLMKINKSSLDYQSHVVIDQGIKPISCFSLDGTMFAYIIIEDKGIEELNMQRKRRYLSKKKTLSGEKLSFRNSDINRMFATQSSNMPQVSDSSDSEEEQNPVGRRILYIIKAEDNKDPQGLIKKMKEAVDNGTYTAKIDETEEGKIYYKDDPICHKGCLNFMSDNGAHMKFDINNRTLIGYGHLEFFVVDLHKESAGFGKMQLHKLNNLLYENILAMTYCTGGTLDMDIHKYESPKLGVVNEDSKPQLFVAAKKKKQSQIHLFEFFTDEKARLQLSDAGFTRALTQEMEDHMLTKADTQVERLLKHLTKPHKHIKVLNYEHEKGDPLPYIKISHDFSKVLFTSDRQRFIVDIDQKKNDNNFQQYMLPHLNLKLKIKYVEEDLYNHGFYVVACMKQDWVLRVIHTHKSKYKIKFDVNVEDERMRVYDLDMNFSKEQNNKSEKNQLTVIGVNQNSFMYTEAYYDEINIEKFPMDQIKKEHWLNALSRKYKKELGILGEEAIDSQERLNKAIELSSKRIPKWLPFNITNIETKEHQFWDFGAFSMSWPSIAFADSMGNVYVANGHQTRSVYRLAVKHQHHGDNHDHDHAHDDHNEKIFCTYITPNQMLYVLTYCKNDEEYLVYQLNLKKKLNFFNQELVNEDDDFGKPVFRYSSKNISNDPKQLFVRNSEGSIEDGYHNKLFMFILHGKVLYKWMEGDDDVTEIQKIQDATMRIGLDNTLYYLIQQTQDGKLVRQEIEQLSIGHMNYFKNRVFKEQLPYDDEIMSFDIDQHKQKLIFVLREIRKDAAQLLRKRLYKVRIFDLVTQKIQIEVNVKDPEIIGVLQSGFYNLIGGHIYFSNDVIKLRYDLLETDQDQLSNLSEKAFFDKFRNVMDLMNGCRVNGQNLLASDQCHRMAYIIEDLFARELPTQVVLSPYLHERRIYLDAPRKNKNYFLTNLKMRRGDRNFMNDMIIASSGIEIKDADKTQRILDDSALDDEITFLIRMNISESKYYVYYSNGQLAKRVDFSSQKRKYGDPVAASFDGEYIVFRKSEAYLRLYNNIDEKLGREAIRDMFYQFTIMKLTPYKLEFVKTVDIKEGVRQMYGENTLEYQKFVDNNKHWLYGQDLDFLFNNVRMKILINQDADVVVGLEHCPPKEDLSKLPAEFNHDHSKDMRLSTKKSVGYNKPIGTQYGALKKLNDEFDSVRQKLFYIEEGQHNNPRNYTPKIKEKKEVAKSIFSSDSKGNGVMLRFIDNQMIKNYVTRKFKLDEYKDEDKQKFKAKVNQVGGSFKKLKIEMNAEYVMYWTEREAFTIAIDDLMMPWKNPMPEPMHFTLEEQNSQKYPKIEKITTGPIPEKVIIVVATSDEEATVINWDVFEKCELNHHIVKTPFFIAFDDKSDYQKVKDHKNELQGEVSVDTRTQIVISQNYVCMSDIQVDMTCFDIDHREINHLYQIERNQQKNQFREESLGSEKGLRFDGRNHNWILFESYLALPCSYLSFLIQEKIADEEPSALDNQFDIEAYNYMFNRSTCFMDSEITRSDSERLEEVLEKMKNLDVNNIGIIQYSTENFFYEKNQVGGVGKFRQLKRRSALSAAFTNQGTPEVEVILSYLSLIEEDASEQYKELFVHLIEYENFQSYLRSSPIQTKQMEDTKSFEVLTKSRRSQLWYPFQQTLYKLCCQRDIFSPIYSHMDDFVIQAQQKDTIVLNSDYYQNELTQRTLDDNNIKENPQHYHEYPCKVMAIRSDWMFETGKYPTIEKSPLAFLQVIADTNNLDYCQIPALQILIAYLYEQYLQDLKNPLYILYLLLDTLFVVFQLIFIQLQLTHVKITESVQLKDTFDIIWPNSNKSITWQDAEKLQNGVNKTGEVILLDVGSYINFQKFLSILQIILMVVGLYYNFGKGVVVDNPHIWYVIRKAREVAWLTADYTVRVLVIWNVFTQESYNPGRFPILDGVEYKSLKGAKNNTDVWKTTNRTKATLGYSLTFEEYESAMILFICAVCFNLLVVLLKILGRLQIYFNTMNQFVDLIENVTKELLGFISFTGLFIIILGWVFSALAQYQILIDSHYDENGIREGVYYGSNVNDKIVTTLKDNAVEDEKDSIEYQTYRSAVFWLYRMMLGDSPYDTFNLYKRSHKSPATCLLFVFYTVITALIMLLLLNIIIAIMAEVQTYRTENKRAVLFKAKLDTIIQQWPRIQSIVLNKTNQPRYIVGVVAREEEESTIDLEIINEQLQTMRIDQQRDDLVLAHIQKEVLKLRSYNEDATDNQKKK